jgi:IrrE N-terminal-like domain
MTQPRSGSNTQEDVLGVEPARALLDTLLTSSRLYRTTADYKALLDFVVRLRNFAPFNAMLLQVQKPGLTYAASAADWWARFGRKPKEGARPLLILWPFGPVALVYDVMDTEGKDLPQDVASFFAHGPIVEKEIAGFRLCTGRKNILWDDLDAGDGKAGSIRCVRRATQAGESNTYRMLVNRNHSPAVRFATLAHELGHLFLGHLGLDKPLGVPLRPKLELAVCELEAESVAFLVCKRNGVTSKSETYLANFVGQHTTVGDLDIYQIMRAAGQVETLLGLGAQSGFTKR